MVNHFSKIFVKTGKLLYKIYVAIGITSMGIVAASVIFAVFSRYFFNKSFRQMEEFIITAFAFTIFWGIGICFIEKEHVAIDSIVRLFPPLLKKITLFFSYAVVLIVLSVMFYQGALYALKFGHQISFGMNIPYIYMYGIIPVGCFLGLICVVISICRDIIEMLDTSKKQRES